MPLYSIVGKKKLDSLFLKEFVVRSIKNTDTFPIVCLTFHCVCDARASKLRLVLHPLAGYLYHMT